MKVFDEYPSSRLFSLDFLRGLTMLLLTIAVPVLMSAHKAFGLPPQVVAQCRHVWSVLSFYDVIMPCFIFMCGAAVPFSLEKRLVNGRPGPGYFMHVAKRFILLYLLGSLAQCGLLSLDPMKIHVFFNTLQVIAVAYVICAVAVLIPYRCVRIALPVVMVLTMGLVVHVCGNGDYSKTGNFAYVFDRIVWGWILPEGQCTLNPNGYFCYLLPQLACNALALCGCECAHLLNSERGQWTKVRTLAALSAGLFAAGWLASLRVPVIKHIYSMSFTLYTCAWCVVALASSYVVTDIWKVRKGMAPVILFGQNALAAYILYMVFRKGINAEALFLTQGVAGVCGAKLQIFVAAVAEAVLLILLLAGWSVWKRYRRL
jgi:predicted acyltransferase